MNIENKIEKLKHKLTEMGPVHPGRISKQFNTCGKKNCKCKDKKQPKKHGPYFQISYSIGGINSSRFLKKEDVPEAKKRIKEYEKFKKQVAALVEAYVQMQKERGFQRGSGGKF